MVDLFRHSDGLPCLSLARENPRSLSLWPPMSLAQPNEHNGGSSDLPKHPSIGRPNGGLLWVWFETPRTLSDDPSVVTDLEVRTTRRGRILSKAASTQRAHAGTKGAFFAGNRRETRDWQGNVIRE